MSVLSTAGKMPGKTLKIQIHRTAHRVISRPWLALYFVTSFLERDGTMAENRQRKQPGNHHWFGFPWRRAFGVGAQS